MIDQRGSDAGYPEEYGRPDAGAVAALAAPVLEGIRAVVEPLPEAVLVADDSGAIRLTNEAADRMFRARPVRSTDDLLSRFEDADVQPAQRERAGPAQLRVRPRNQPNTWFVLDRTTLGTDSDTASIFILRDVTATAELRPEREAFLGVLSHELRTPLTTIYAGSSVLARRPWLSPPATQSLARDISSEAARLYDLVENLLVIARLERRILQPLDELVDLGRAMEAAIRMVSERFANARIAAAGTANAPAVRGDATYVAHACRNLLLTAVPTQSLTDEFDLTIHIEADFERQDVAVTVVGSGPVLVAEEGEHAFDLPSPDSGAGTGVGPYVLRQTVEAMGGRAWAVNRPDGAVELGFALPIATPLANAPLVKESASPDFTPEATNGLSADPR